MNANQIQDKITKIVAEYFRIIRYNIDEYGWDDSDMELVEKCCSPEKTEELQQVISKFIVQYAPNHISLKEYEIICKAIVFYYFQMVLIESQYQILLETEHILKKYTKEYKKQFHHIYGKLVFGDEPEFAEIRQKFLAFNPESFKDSISPKSKPENEPVLSVFKSATSSSRKKQRSLTGGGGRHVKSRKSPYRK